MTTETIRVPKEILDDLARLHVAGFPIKTKDAIMIAWRHLKQSGGDTLSRKMRNADVKYHVLKLAETTGTSETNENTQNALVLLRDILLCEDENMQDGLIVGGFLRHLANHYGISFDRLVELIQEAKQ